MIFDAKWFFILITVIGTRCQVPPAHRYDKIHGLCGCRVMRACYAKMLSELREQDEERCLEPVEIGSSTITVYLKALSQYCGHLINVTKDHMTHEGRYLYEVYLHARKEEKIEYNTVPLIFIDAGQDAGDEPVQTAMHMIEHLMACEEHEQMMLNFRWVILPCVNPDGLEYARFDRPRWKKNTRKAGGVSHGVDITRNFDIHWDECPKNTNGFSRAYPGPEPGSEIETKFVKDVLKKYKDNIKAYIAFKRDGHGILYPHGYSPKTDDLPKRTIQTAELISQKVNQRGGYHQTFLNTTIYDWKGAPWCGNSVDYVFNLGVELAYEMRVGFGRELQIFQKFQKLETGFHHQLMSSYFSGIRFLSNVVAEDFEREKKNKEA